MALDIVANVQQAQADIARLSKEFDGLSKATTKLGSATSSLSKEHAALAKTVGTMQAAFTGITTRLASVEKAMRSQATAAAAVTKANSSAASSFSAVAAAARGVGGNLSVVQKELNKLLATEEARLAVTNRVIAADNIADAGLRKRFISIRSTSAQTDMLNAAMVRQAKLTAELTMLDNAAYQAMLKKNAGIQATIKARTTESAQTAILNAAKKQQATLSAQLVALDNAEYRTILQKTAAIQASIAARTAEITATRGQTVAKTQATSAETKATAATNANTVANNANAASYRTLHGAIRGTSGALGSLWMTYGQIAPLVAAFTATGLVINIQKMGSAFEYMATYASAIGGAATSVGEIKKELLGISGVARTPRELAAGMVELTRAGRTTAQALKEIGTVAKFSTVSQMDMAKSTLQLVTLTSAFSSTTKSASGGMLDLATTADIVSSAALGSATTFEAFNTAMKYMIPISQKAGFTLQEAAAAAMVMADKGLAGSIGTTAIRTGLTRMIAPSKRVIAVLTEAGASMEKFADGDQVMNLGEMVLQLEKVRKQLTKEEWFEFAYRGLGLRGEQLQNLMVGMEDYIRHLDRMADAVGFLDRVFDELTKTTQIQFKELQADLERALITAFSGESARKAITALRDAINDGRFADLLDTLTTALYHVGEGFGKILPFVFEFGEEVFKIGGTLLVAKAGVVMFNAAMNASPIMKFVGGLILARAALERLGSKEAFEGSDSAVARFIQLFDPAGKFDGAGQRLTELQSLEIAMAKLNEQLVMYRENNTPRADGQVSVVEQDLIKRISALNEAIKGVYADDNLAQAHKLFEFDPGMMEFEYYVERVGVSLAETRGHAKVGAEGLLSYDDALKKLGASASEVNEIMRLANTAGFSDEERGMADILERYRQKKEKLSEVIDLMVKYKKLAPEMADAAKQALSEEMIAAMDKVIAKQEEMNNKLTEGQLEKLDNYIDTYFAANDRIFKEDMSMADKRKKLQAELAGFIENEDSRTTRGKIANLNKWYAEGQRLLRGHGKDLADLNRVYQEKSKELLLLELKEKNDLSAINKKFFDELRLQYQNHYRTIELLEFGWMELIKTGQSELGDFFVEQFGGIEGAWGSLWDSMLKKFAAILVEMAVLWAAQKFTRWLTGDSSISIGGGGSSAKNPSGMVADAAASATTSAVLGAAWTKLTGGAMAETTLGKVWTAAASKWASYQASQEVAKEVAMYAGREIGQQAAQQAAQQTAVQSGSQGMSTGATAATAGSAGASAVLGAVGVMFAVAQWSRLTKDRTPLGSRMEQEGITPGSYGVGSELQTLTHETKKSLGELHGQLSMFTAAAYNTAESMVVLRKEYSSREEEEADWHSLKMMQYDQERGTWSDQTAVFNEMLGTMIQMAPATTDAINSTAQYIAEMYKLPGIADELAMAFMETGGEMSELTVQGDTLKGSLAHLGLEAGIETRLLSTMAQELNKLSVVNSQTIQSTAALVAEMHGVPEATASLASAFQNLASDARAAVASINQSNRGGDGVDHAIRPSAPSDSRARGGYIPSTGTYTLHKGETVISAANALLGSYATGTDYVPQTGPYLLHRGESVNTASSNSEMVALLKELKYIALATAKHTKKSSDSMVRIEYTGIPEYSRGAA